MLEKIRRQIREILQGTDAKVYLFGSYAKRNFRQSSDVDIAIKGLSRQKIRQLREHFEESNIPCKVDIVDLNFASADLIGEIERTGILWKND